MSGAPGRCTLEKARRSRPSSSSRPSGWSPPSWCRLPRQRILIDGFTGPGRRLAHRGPRAPGDPAILSSALCSRDLTVPIGQPEPLGDRDEGEVRPIVEDDDDSLVGVEHVQSAEHVVSIEDRTERIAGVDELGGRIERDETDPAPPAHSVATQIDEDPIEPRRRSLPDSGASRSIAMPGSAPPGSHPRPHGRHPAGSRRAGRRGRARSRRGAGSVPRSSALVGSPRRPSRVAGVRRAVKSCIASIKTNHASKRFFESAAWVGASVRWMAGRSGSVRHAGPPPRRTGGMSVAAGIAATARRSPWSPSRHDAYVAAFPTTAVGVHAGAGTHGELAVAISRRPPAGPASRRLRHRGARRSAAPAVRPLSRRITTRGMCLCRGYPAQGDAIAWPSNLSAMADTLKVILELGKKRKVVAGAMDWPGLDRWGTSEHDALDKLSSYLPRYAGVAERAGLASAFARSRDAEVVERVPGSSSTDFWGIAHVPSQIERDVLSPADLERRLDLLSRLLGILRRRRGTRLPRAPPRISRRWPESRPDHPPRVRQRARAVLPQDRGPDPAGGRADPGWPRDASAGLSSMPSGPTTRRASRRGPGRSSSSCAAPPTTSWITRGKWRTGTSECRPCGEPVWREPTTASVQRRPPASGRCRSPAISPRSRSAGDRDRDRDPPSHRAAVRPDDWRDLFAY